MKHNLGCSNRFTHANRRCPLHPQHGVRRDRLSAQLASSKHHSSKENQTNVKSVKLINNDQQVNYKQTNKEDDVQKEVVNWLKKQSDQKSSAYSSGIKRKLNGRPVRKIKKPKFLDDSSSSSEEEEEITNEYNQIEELIEEEDGNCAQLIWKKKRAALELHAKESSSSTFKKCDSLDHSNDQAQRSEYNQDVSQSMNYSLDEVMLNKSHSSIDESFQEDEVYDDRLVGALALIELSKSRPIVEYSSEIDLSDVNEYTVHEYSVNEIQVEHCSDYLASSQGDYSDIHYSYNEEYY